ncbi:MAG TPA: hypothetical protein PLB99_08705 [Thermotogota bacterium]|nr:hypothetical protein [Thermotogota bacterium]
MNNIHYINQRVDEIKRSKRGINHKDTDYTFLADQKNGVSCHYSGEENRITYCTVSERLPVREEIIKEVLINFWDSQPEYYRDYYEDLN